MEDTLINELSALFYTEMGEEVKKLANLPDDFLERLTFFKKYIEED